MIYTDNGLDCWKLSEKARQFGKKNQQIISTVTESL